MTWAKFEAVSPPRARLVYELCVGTGQRTGDVLKFRGNHFTEGAFDFTQGKTDKSMWIPLTDRLRRHLESFPKEGFTVVCGAKGRPANYRVITDEMLAVRQSMQHPAAKSYLTHGLRKNATIKPYLAGCDDGMVKAVTGHSGVEMLKKYGGMVRQRELAIRAQVARNRADRNKSGT